MVTSAKGVWLETDYGNCSTYRRRFFYQPTRFDPDPGVDDSKTGVRGDFRGFMNEYDPYLQHTGHRPLERFDPVDQDDARLRVWLVADEMG